VKVSAFRLYGESNRKQIEQQLQELLDGWSREWFDESNLEIGIRNVSGSEDSVWQQLNSQSQLFGDVDSEILIFVTTNGKLNPFLQLLPTVDSAKGSDPALERQIQIAVASRCVQDLAQQLIPREPVEQELNSGKDIEGDTLARLFRPGSGWGVVTVARDDLSLVVLLGPEILQRAADLPRRPQPRGGLPDAFSALASQPLALRAELGSTSLTIGEIENLAIGDVIKLDQSCDTPIRISVGMQQTIADGQLGLQSGNKAVKLRSRTV